MADGKAEMATKVTYYAIVNNRSSRAEPAGVVRRSHFDGGGQRDEALRRDLTWGRTTLLYSSERGDLDNDLVEISEDEAERIVERIRQKVQKAE